jgi:hypothetical protein
MNYGKDLGHKTGGPKLTHHIKWDGKTWSDGIKINGQKSGISRGDFMFTPDQNIQYFLSEQDGKDGVISTWTSNDGGKSFVKTKELLRKPKASFATTAIIKNSHPDARVIVGERSSLTPHRKIYLVGENGPIQRRFSDATLQKDTSTFKSK